MTEYLHTYGVYIRRLTAKLFAKANGLPAEVLREDRGAFFASVLGAFNHQTHHQGQATTLLFQASVDPGPTDLLVMMMEE